MESDTTSWPRRARKLATKLALALVVFIVALVAAELGHRLWLAAQGRPFDSDAQRALFRRTAEPLLAYVPGADARAVSPDVPVPILHPYVGGESWHDTGDVLAHFIACDGSDYDVLVVGGSVAALFAESERARLESELATLPALAGRRVSVLNFAHATYKQPQQLNRITWLLSMGHAPELVINVDGFNEVALGYENARLGTHPTYPSFPVWGLAAQDLGRASAADLTVLGKLALLRDESLGEIRRAWNWKLHRSSLLSAWVGGNLRRLSEQRHELTRSLRVGPAESMDERQRLQMRGPEAPSDPAKAIAMCVAAWEQSSLSLDAVCSVRRIAYVHVLQPTLYDEDSKPWSDVERALPPPSPDWIEAVRLGYPLLRERGAALVQNSVAFVDGSRVFASMPETLYMDACHFTVHGNAVLHDLVTPVLVERVQATLADRASGR